jgi:hypothetical protein
MMVSRCKRERHEIRCHTVNLQQLDHHFTQGGPHKARAEALEPPQQRNGRYTYLEQLVVRQQQQQLHVVGMVNVVIEERRLRQALHTHLAHVDVGIGGAQQQDAADHAMRNGGSQFGNLRAIRVEQVQAGRDGLQLERAVLRVQVAYQLLG